LDSKYNISKTFSKILGSVARRGVIRDGYKKLLPILKENKDFKSTNMPEIVRLERVIERKALFFREDIRDIRDTLHRMVVDIAREKE
jgi:hypothetical protein